MLEMLPAKLLIRILHFCSIHNCDCSECEQTLSWWIDVTVSLESLTR
jgi:hypothetical protein